jgi:hypothetical protein
MKRKRTHKTRKMIMKKQLAANEGNDKGKWEINKEGKRKCEIKKARIKTGDIPTPNFATKWQHVIRLQFQHFIWQIMRKRSHLNNL